MINGPESGFHPEGEITTAYEDHTWAKRFSIAGAIAGVAAGIAILIASGDIPSALTTASSLMDKVIGVGMDVVVGGGMMGVAGAAVGWALGWAVDGTVNPPQPNGIPNS